MIVCDNLSPQSLQYIDNNGKTKIEKWKPIKDYEGLYEISNLGRARSINRIAFHYRSGTQKLKGKMLKQSSRRGYRNVKLYKNGIGRTFSVHRLVAIQFIKNNGNKPQINHIGGVKNDNRYFQLEWVTSIENQHHAINNGLIKKVARPWLNKKGALFHSSIPVNQLTKDRAFIKCFSCASEAARILKIDASGITKCVKGKVKTSGGYKWEYSSKKNK